MKVSEMIKNLQEFMAANGDLDCYYAVDDEGNGYSQIYYTPTKYYVSEDGEVMQREDLEEYELRIEDVNPICIVN